MAKYTPQYNIFKINNKIAAISNFIFWVIFLLPFVQFLLSYFKIIVDLFDIINILNIISIAFFFLLEILSEYILIPLADSIRRDDFIDNSFGSKLVVKNSVDYYDNDEVKLGLYKVAVNLFENCYFTFSLIKTTTVKRTVIPILVIIVMLVFAYYGFKKVPLALSILQALFSANIFGQLIKHIILYVKLKSIQECWISLFQHSDLKANIDNYQVEIYRHWLRYEVLHSKINAGIPEKIYKKLNPSLTRSWNEIKEKYGIN